MKVVGVGFELGYVQPKIFRLGFTFGKDLIASEIRLGYQLKR
jgi:hypothetical protein